jgi:hypothetical protein
LGLSDEHLDRDLSVDLALRAPDPVSFADNTPTKRI